MGAVVVVRFGLVRLLIALGVWLALLPTAAGAAGPRYDVAPLGPVGGRDMQPYGMNATGDVAGTFVNARGDRRGFVVRGGVLSELPPLPGGHTSRAYAIDDAGRAVGQAHGGGAVWRPVVFGPDGPTPIAALGTSWAEPLGMNNRGDVVGRAMIDASRPHGFLLRNGAIAPLPEPCCPTANDVNDAGDVVGHADHRAYLVRGGRVHDLGTFGGYYTVTRAVNERGQVAGSSMNTNGDYRAFLWSDGVMRDLGSVTGGTTSQAWGLNNLGHVVGEAWGTTIPTAAFLHADGATYDLNTLIPPGTGWRLRGARAINDRGQIVGVGWLNGQSAMFLLTPRPPDSRAPTTTARVAPAPNGAGWLRGDATVALTAVDEAGGSGVHSITYAASGAQRIASTTVEAAAATVRVTAEGETTLTYAARDRADNAEGARSLVVRVDRTPPTVAYAGNLDTYDVDQTVRITCRAEDATSGVAASTCQDVVGPAHDFALGSNSRSAAATDRAGNEAAGATAFVVRATPAGLCRLTTRLVEKPRLAESLCAKLDASARAAASGRDGQHAVRAYQNEVRAQSGKAIPAERAQLLLRLAEVLRREGQAAAG